MTAGRAAPLAQQREGPAVARVVRRSADEEFAEFVAANHGRLLHLADLLVGDRTIAEDLLQTVLIRTYLRWAKVRQENPLGYIRTALSNERTDLWRKGGARERSMPVPPDHALDDHAAEVVGRNAIQRSLAALTARERAVVVLRYYEDLSEAEIARTLRIAPGTVKSTCARALSKLRISPDLNPKLGERS
jgi:RNA polymerase sigma-70 factor (sigma-E family)